MDLFTASDRRAKANENSTLRDPLLTPSGGGQAAPSTPTGGARLIPARSLSKDWLRELNADGELV